MQPSTKALYENKQWLPSDKYLDVIKAKTPNPVPPEQRAAQDLGRYV
ncbi:MAG: hypothetical protein AAGA75_23265 [Cyanobacteria bacterium P01_E01_bin.6]